MPENDEKLNGLLSELGVGSSGNDDFNDDFNDVDESVETESTETENEDVEEKQEVINIEEKEKPSKYYERMAEKDNEIRKLKEALSKNQNTKDYKKLAKENPLEVMTDLGLDATQILDMLGQNFNENNKSNNNKALDKDEHLSKLERLEKELEAIKLEKQKETEHKLITQEKNKIKDIVSKNVDKYEVLNALGDEAVDKAFESAVEHFNLYNTIPEIEDILNILEEHYTDYYKETLNKFSSLNKLGKQREQVRQKEIKTLSQNMENGVQSPQTLNDEERFKRALKILIDSEKNI